LQCVEGKVWQVVPTKQESNIFEVRVHEDESPATFHFRQPFWLDPDSVILGSWTGTYVNTDAILTDTVVIGPVAVGRPAFVHAPAPVKFHVLPADNGSIFCTITSPLRSAEGSIDLFTISGRKIVARHLALNRPGTHVLRINSSDLPGGAVAGIYMCKLSVGNFKPVSRRVTIH
jgi:hypothetical protein